MEIGPIIRSMLRSKIGLSLLVVEIAVTLAIVLNGLNLGLGAIHDMRRPTGIDEENITRVKFKPFGEHFSCECTADDIIEQDLDAIRALPGVVDATPSLPCPLAGSPNTLLAKAAGRSDTALVTSTFYVVDDHFLDALGLELVHGRAFESGEVPEACSVDAKAIITLGLAEALFPDGRAVGKTIEADRKSYEVVGVTGKLHDTGRHSKDPAAQRVVFLPGRPHYGTLGGAPEYLYLVRAKPGQSEQVAALVKEQMRKINQERLIFTRPLAEVKARGQRMTHLTMRVAITVMVLLLFVTGLGIYGMTSFAVAERTHQLGIRRALGARRTDIIRYFLLENSLTLLVGMGAGLIGAELLNLALVKAHLGDALGGLPVTAGVGLLWLVGLAATVGPARRAANVAPVVASRAG